MVANAAATHTQRWARAMADLGHEVRLFSVRDHPIEGVEVVSYLRTGATTPSQAAVAVGYGRLRLGLRGGIDDFGPDIVHAHYASTNGYLTATATSKPTVLTVWGTDVVPKPGKTLSRAQAHRVKKALEHASIVTSTSDFMAEHVKSLMPGVPITIVPFGVDTSVFAPTPLTDTADVLVAKSLEPRYGIEYVIEAMTLVTAAVPRVRLSIAGDGSLRKDLERLAGRSNADIRFLGKVPHEDLPAHMAAASVVVNPTVVDESFGVVVLEAQAVGRPVVSTRVGAIPTVCLEGETALLVPPRDPEAMADAIIDVLQRRELAEAVTIGPRFVADNFTWESSVDRMDQIYSTVANA